MSVLQGKNLLVVYIDDCILEAKADKELKKAIKEFATEFCSTDVG